MRRRSSSGSERVKPPKRKAASLKRSKAPKATRNRGVSILGQETFVARLTRERDEALLRETANSEILRLISSSPGDLELVFRTILEHATLICNAKFGVMQLSERDGLRAVALHDVPPAYALAMRRNPVFRPIVGHPLDRVASAKQVVHILDARAEQRMRGWMVELAGARTLLLVPMLKDNELVGVISIYRQEVCAFTDKQIALLQNFAAQAVIAIENARLLNELRQSLERQTATSEVLGVISRSPGELETVFHAILENATQICEANFGILQLLEGEAARIAAMHNVPAAFVQHRQREPLLHASPASAIGRAIATRRLVHIPDYAADAAYSTRDPAAVKLVELAGARSLINVPMLKDDELIGIISIYRQEVRPFTDKQIELVQNFAAQAVIAIENTRLLNELRQSLEQQKQTATADVLKVISRSTFDLQSVLNNWLNPQRGYVAQIAQRSGWLRKMASTTTLLATVLLQNIRRAWRGHRSKRMTAPSSAGSCSKANPCTSSTHKPIRIASWRIDPDLGTLILCSVYPCSAKERRLVSCCSSALSCKRSQIMRSHSLKHSPTKP